VGWVNVGGWVGGFFRGVDGGATERERSSVAPFPPFRLFVYRVALVEMQTFCIVVVGGPLWGWLWVVPGWLGGLWRRLCGCKMPRNGTAVHAHVYKHSTDTHTHTHTDGERARERSMQKQIHIQNRIRGACREVGVGWFYQRGGGGLGGLGNEMAWQGLLVWSPVSFLA